MGRTQLLLFVFVFVVLISSGNGAKRSLSYPVPNGWTPSIHHKRSSLSAHEIKVIVALSQRNLEQLESEFWAVSDPKNAKYGKHKEFHELVDMVAPSQSSVDQVTEYFRGIGIRSDKIELLASKDFMTISLSVEQAETIFQTSYEPYVHSKTGKVAVGMRGSYFLDDRIDSHIDFVSRFSKISAPRVRRPPVLAESPMNKRLVSEPSPIVPRSSEVSSPTFAASNAPFIPYPYAVYQGVFVQLILVCPDGSGPSISGDSPSNTTLHCGAVEITHVNINIVSKITSNSLFTELADIRSADLIFKCSEVSYWCLAIAQANNMPADSTFVIYSVNTTGKPHPIPLYVPYVIQACVHYSDNTTSNIGESTEAEGPDLAHPSFLHSFYSVTSPIVKNSHNNQSVVEFAGDESYSTTDLQLFFQTYGLADYSNLVQAVHPENSNSSDPTIESNLDIQSIMGIAQNCTTIFWANDDTASDLDWITEVLNQPSSPLVFSISWIGSEKEAALDYLSRANVEFMKAGVRGISVLYASGDDGPYRHGGQKGNVIDVGFPASSPYVTSVGGTQFYSKKDASCYNGDRFHCAPEEIVCSIATGAIITSGGGFSGVFPRPAYQAEAVSAYVPFVHSIPGVNTSNRAHPDVSMVAHNIPMFINGGFSIQGGTSASTPFFAGLVTLLNDIRLSSGNAPLGFLNPFIYSLDQNAFNDIVRGNITCTQYACFSEGYSAAPGWDAATGRGSPIFGKWAAAVARLPRTNP